MSVTGWPHSSLIPGDYLLAQGPQEHGRMSPTHGPDTLSPTGGLSVDDFRKVLMKTGLVLVVLGHMSFIAAALLHGTVLRYVAAPHDAAALQYCVVNILSVTSAILVGPGRAGLAGLVGAGKVLDESPPRAWDGPVESPRTNPCSTYQRHESPKLPLPQLPHL